jgi:coatomer subunit beta'
MICGSDDLSIRVYNYHTHERVTQFSAHNDYIRALAIHPSKSLVLSSSDDLTVKLWDWEKNWTCTRTFEGHAHYVMSLAFNPKDPNTFASGSLDRSIKVRGLTPTPASFLRTFSLKCNWFFRFGTWAVGRLIIH